MMRVTTALLTATLAAAFAAPVGAQGVADSAAVHDAVREYAEGFYAGDVRRMRKVLHPSVAKRMLFSETGRQSVLAHMDRGDLLEITLQGGGSTTPPRDRLQDVAVLDLYRNAATAKLVTAEGVEYLHLARWEGRWMVLDVLWEMRSESGSDHGGTRDRVAPERKQKKEG